MKVFTVNDKIRYWDGVRDLAQFKSSLENNYALELDVYRILDYGFVFDFSYNDFEVSQGENIIIFKKQVVGFEFSRDVMGWPSMLQSDRERVYNEEELKMIEYALGKWTLDECKMYENPKNSIQAPSIFPYIERKLITNRLETNEYVTVKEVPVVKYEP